MCEAQWEQLALDDARRSLAGSRETGKRSRLGSGERESWDELIIPRRLRDAIARINPGAPAIAVDDAVEDRADCRHHGMRELRTSGSTSS